MNNIYEDFISYLKEKEVSLTGYIEKHRIVHGHSGGKYEDKNIEKQHYRMKHKVKIHLTWFFNYKYDYGK